MSVPTMASPMSLRIRKNRVNYTDGLDENDQPEKTKEKTQWALKLFNDFCDEVGISIQFTSKNVQSLANALRRLYCSAKAQKYHIYEVSVFRSIRYELKRHFREKLKVDIIKDEAFANANKAFTDRENRIKAAGEGLMRAFAPVKEKNLKLLKEYFKKNMQNPTPQQLLEYVWFILQYYKLQIGTDRYDNLKRTRFIIRTDAEGKKCILPNKCEQDLSPRGNRGNKDVVSSSSIPAMKGNVLCPVKAFRLYKSKIHKDLNLLFQKPKKLVDQSQSFWFDRVPFGSSLNEMMATLSANANISMKYTNQSFTAAAIAKLIWGGSKEKGKDVPSNPEPRHRGDNSTTVRQVKMKSPLNMTIVKKKKRRRSQKPNTTPVNEDNNTVAESLNQKKSSLKTGSTVASPPPIINMTRESQQQGVKLTLKKSALSVSSDNNNRPCASFASPSPGQDPLPSKQAPSKMLSSSNISNNNNQQSEMLTSNKTKLCRMHQLIRNKNEKSSENGQNLLQSRTDEVLPGGYEKNPSSENGQNVVKSGTDEVLPGGYRETPSSENVGKSGTDAVLPDGYRETPSSLNGTNVLNFKNEVLPGGYQETPSSENEQNVWKSRINEVLPGGYEETSSLNGQNVVKSGTDEVLPGGYRETPSSIKGTNVLNFKSEVLRGRYQETTSSENEQNVLQSRIDEALRGEYKETPSSENGQNVVKSRIDEVLPGGYQETPSENRQNARKSGSDNVVFVDEYRVPPSRSTFMVMDVHSRNRLFTDRNVAKTMIPIETPTHSYVVQQHQNSMLANMAELWKKGKFCDATVGNGTMKIMVHKIVLLALSPQLLNSSNSDLTSECFQFTFPQEIGGEALWAFSKYMYEGVISLNSGVLEDIEQISVILNLRDLKDMCNLYRNQFNPPSNTSLPSQSLAAIDTPIILDPLPPSIKSEVSANGPPSIKSEASAGRPPSIRSKASASGPPSIRSEPSVSGPPSIRSKASASGPPSIRSEPSVSGPPSIRSEPSVSGPPSLRSEPSVSGPPSLRSEPSVSGPLSLKSEPSPSGPPSLKSEPSPSGPPSLRSEPSPSGPPSLRLEPSANGPPFIKSEASVSGPPFIKSEASVSKVTFHSPPSGDITQTVSRPVQHLRDLTAESNNPRLHYSSKQSSIGDINRASDDGLCVTISGSDSDSDVTVVSYNIKRNPVRKRRRKHLEKNILLSRQSPSESFLNDHLPETWAGHVYGGNDNLTNTSPSKKQRLTDNLAIDDSQNFKISCTSSNQRSNDIPYSRIGNSDESC